MNINGLEPNQLAVNRGSMLTFGVKRKNGETFKAGDIIRVKVMEAYNVENVVIQKDFKAENDIDVMPIVLLGSETKIGEYINQPIDYWYEIELFPDTDYTQTILGYDDEPKIFTLRPEGGEKK